MIVAIHFLNFSVPWWISAHGEELGCGRGPLEEFFWETGQDVILATWVGLSWWWMSKPDAKPIPGKKTVDAIR